MIPSTRAMKIGSNIGRGIETYGDMVWEVICDEMRIDRPFSREDVVDAVAKRCGISRRYARDLALGVLMTIEDQA